MRPDVTEQLSGLRRVLLEVIAPELKDPYPLDILTGVCATLETLAAGWDQVPSFLRWDGEQCVALLAELLRCSEAALTSSLREEITEVVAAPPPDPADLNALTAFQLRGRETLAHAVTFIEGRPECADLLAALVAYQRERAGRYPLTTIWRPPAATAESAAGGTNAD